MTLGQIGWVIGWEWINICLEYTAVAWWRRPRLFGAVVLVNLLTHPLFWLYMENCEPGAWAVAAAEVAIVAFEGLVLMVCYGRRAWRACLGVSFLMNAVSCGVGLLLQS